MFKVISKYTMLNEFFENLKHNIGRVMNIIVYCSHLVSLQNTIIILIFKYNGLIKNSYVNVQKDLHEYDSSFLGMCFTCIGTLILELIFLPSSVSSSIFTSSHLCNEPYNAHYWSNFGFRGHKNRE